MAPPVKEPLARCTLMLLWSTPESVPAQEAPSAFTSCRLAFLRRHTPLCHSVLLWGHGQWKLVAGEVNLAGVLGGGKEDFHTCGNGDKPVSVKILPASINLLLISNIRTSKFAHSLGDAAGKYWDITDTMNSCFAVLWNSFGHCNLPMTPKETVS